jgi:hypothetical protein
MVKKLTRLQRLIRIRKIKTPEELMNAFMSEEDTISLDDFEKLNKK